MFGIAHDATGRWTAALIASLAITAVMFAVGWVAGSPGVVEDEALPTRSLVSANPPNDDS
jgi:cyanate permease